MRSADVAPADIVLGVAVMHVPGAGRNNWLKQIQAVWPEAIVVKDQDRNGIWPTAKRAWKKAAAVEGATHCLVLQDDMLPEDGGRERLIAAIHATDVVSGFQPTGAMDSADYHNGREPCAPYESGVWGGTVVVPIGHVQPFLDYGDAHPELPFDDAKLSGYCRENRVVCWHVYPTVWVHIGWDCSLVGNTPHPWRRGDGVSKFATEDDPSATRKWDRNRKRIKG